MSPCYPKCDRMWFGLVLFVVGLVVLLQRFDLIPAETWDYLWPSILVVSGLKMIIPCRGSCCRSSCDMKDEMCEDCEDAPCSCDVEPMPMKKTSVKKPSKRK